MNCKFTSIGDFFQYLNENCTYLILRNWDNLLDSDIYGNGHEDIDLLCNDLNEFIRLTHAKKIHKYKYCNNYVIEISAKNVRFDVRYIGDGYYPSEWENVMLKRRQKRGIIYTMSDKDYFYSLTYHALLQKPNLTKEYRIKLFSLLEESISSNCLSEKLLLDKLKEFIVENRYVVCIPLDPGVFIKWKYFRYIGYKMDFIRLMKRLFFNIRFSITSAI